MISRRIFLSSSVIGNAFGSLGMEDVEEETEGFFCKEVGWVVFDEMVFGGIWVVFGGSFLVAVDGLMMGC